MTDDDYPGAPRWVKVLGIIVLLLILAFIVRHVASGGFRSHAG